MLSVKWVTVWKDEPLILFFSEKNDYKIEKKHRNISLSKLVDLLVY